MPHDLHGAGSVAPFDPWRHRFTLACVAATVPLLLAGGLVTSTGSGLAVPDWPLSFGQVFPPMVGGVLYEHGHRLIAASVGLMTAALAIWFALRERRRWVRRLAAGALGAVVAQGLLGGLTVILRLPPAVSVAHACLAQAFFCALVVLALGTSRGFMESGPGPARGRGASPLQTLGTASIVALAGQLILGAVMRHTGAGLAIPDFPLAFGKLVPPLRTFEIAVHFTHRVGALVASILIVWTALGALRARPRRRDLAVPALLALALLATQILLGAASVTTRLAVLPTTLHLVNGALLLATCLVLTLRSSRVPHLSPSAVSPPSGERSRSAGRLADFVELTKPRVTTLVLATTLAGFYLGSRGPLDTGLLIHTLLGTLLVAAGTSALNQYLERDADARMLRTRNRPLPQGRIAPGAALLFAAAISIGGILHLALAVNLITALLAALTLASYVFVYTPLKKVTSFCTLVGAIPGALPPLGGWTAAQGEVAHGGLALFAILFVWQLPHSLAIGMMYREDYARGGFRLLPVLHPDGGSTARQILAHSLVLLPVSLLPALLGITGPVYFYGALALGLGLLASTLPVARSGTARAARRVLLASVIYLPVLLGLMAFDRQAPRLP
jgi:protoheme IX farnesyltransferase